MKTPGIHLDQRSGAAPRPKHVASAARRIDNRQIDRQMQQQIQLDNRRLIDAFLKEHPDKVIHCPSTVWNSRQKLVLPTMKRNEEDIIEELLDDK